VIAAPMPKDEAKKKVKARGVSNRNRGLQWIRENSPDPKGVIYFADDDNTYDLRLFDEVSALPLSPLPFTFTSQALCSAFFLLYHSNYGHRNLFSTQHLPLRDNDFGHSFIPRRPTRSLLSGGTETGNR